MFDRVSPRDVVNLLTTVSSGFRAGRDPADLLAETAANRLAHRSLRRAAGSAVRSLAGDRDALASPWVRLIVWSLRLLPEASIGPFYDRIAQVLKVDIELRMDASKNAVYPVTLLVLLPLTMWGFSLLRQSLGIEEFPSASFAGSDPATFVGEQDTNDPPPLPASPRSSERLDPRAQSGVTAALAGGALLALGGATGVPIARRLARPKRRAAAMSCALLSACLEAGSGLEEAIRWTATSIADRRVRSALSEMIPALIRGESVASAVDRSKLVETGVMRRVGGAAGDPQLLFSAIYHELLARMRSHGAIVAGLVQPLTTLLVAAAYIAALVRLVSPMLDSLQEGVLL